MQSLFLGCGLFLLYTCSSASHHFEIAKEYPAPNEDKTVRELTEAIKEGIIKKYEGRKILRDAHPKHYGCLKADFTVHDLPADLRVGVFKTPGKYSSWIRFSSALSSVESDQNKTLMGMAVKVIGAEGEKLLKEEGNAKVQDFVLVSGPIHPMKNAEEFVKLVKKGIWYFLNPFDSHFHELGLISEGRKRHATPLETRYWSATPYLFGDGRAVKYSARPCAAPTRNVPETLTDNYLREAMADQLSRDEVCFDFMVQFQTDANRMLIEDSRIEWNEKDSPFIKTATIRIPKQTFDSEKQMEFCENISYNPWHSLTVHRPLGSINRARKNVYSEISKFRREQNGVKQPL